ncbi:hypothetical protein GCM10010505_38880 [Kitasatospora aburaviensis]
MARSSSSIDLYAASSKVQSRNWKRVLVAFATASKRTSVRGSAAGAVEAAAPGEDVPAAVADGSGPAARVRIRRSW